MKKLIISADDFGLSEEKNNIIYSAIKSSAINSLGIIVNTDGFKHALNLLQELNIDLGLHFNIFEGKPVSNAALLCNSSGDFNKSYIDLFLRIPNKKLKIQIEDELKAQLDKILKYHNITHLDSHCHYHSIPYIFDIFVKVAKEYKIKYIRTQKEPFYLVYQKLLNKKFPINLIKHILLNTLSIRNYKKIKKENLETNDSALGILYTGQMDKDAVLKGLKYAYGNVEIILHPYLKNEYLLNDYDII